MTLPLFDATDRKPAAPLPGPNDSATSMAQRVLSGAASPPAPRPASTPKHSLPLSAWDHRKWGSINDPIHKSDLWKISGDYSCLRELQYRRSDAVANADREPRTTVDGKSLAGTATHETIRRGLTNPQILAAIRSGSGISVENVRRVLDEEARKEASGREVVWRAKYKPETVLADVAHMARGAILRTFDYVKEIIALEAYFLAPVGKWWIGGALDLIGRDYEDRLLISDWKTGATKAHQIELDHGWDSGLYASACKDGLFLRSEFVVLEAQPDGRWKAKAPHGVERVRATRYEAQVAAAEEALRVELAGYAPGAGFSEGFFCLQEYPERLYYVHLPDYVPYQKAGAKEVKTDLDAAFWSKQKGHDAEGNPIEVRRGDKVKYIKNDLRGPAWYPMRRTEHDVPRLLALLKNCVGTIRLGRFFESIGEKCSRCPYQAPCLTAGYELQGDDKKQLNKNLSALDDFDVDDGMGDESDAA